MYRDQLNRNNAYLSVLPDLAGDEVSVLQLVDESLARVVEQQATNTTQSLSSQELHLGLGVLGVNQTSRVNLDLLEVDSAGANGKSELVAVTSAVVSVGGGQFVVLRTVLLEQGVAGEVGGVSTGSEDDGAVCLLLLALVLVLNTNDSAGLVLEKLGDTGLHLDLDSVGIGDGEILQALHLSVGNDLYKMR